MNRVVVVGVLVVGACWSAASEAGPRTPGMKGPGTLDEALVTRQVRASASKFRACYEKERRATPGLAGTVRATFTIGVDGTVTRARAKGMHANVERCIANAVKAITFPRPTGGEVHVVYPFSFAYGESATDGTAVGGLTGTGLSTLTAADLEAARAVGSWAGAALTTMATGSVVLERPTVRGALDPMHVRQRVEGARPTLLACYEAELQHDALLVGALTVTFTIGADGTVAAATARGVSGPVAACVADVIEKITFPAPPRGEVHVAYPMTFGGPGYGLGELGPGGGGTGQGTFGIGSIGTIGHGQGSGSGFGLGSGSRLGGIGGRAPATTVTLGQPTVRGRLDPASIRRIVRRTTAKLRYCFERRLVADPTVAGTVTAELAIGATGSVARATAAGVHPEVSACVARVLQHLSFPKPADGAVVRVTYPFTFTPPAPQPRP